MRGDNAGEREPRGANGPPFHARDNGAMTSKASVVIEKDEHGYYAWCPELKGCQSQSETLEDTMVSIREAIELYLETLTEEERSAALSQEILTTAVEVHA